MSTENKPTNHKDLLTKLHHARALLDGCIAELSGGRSRKPKKKLEPSPPGKSDALRNLDFEANERGFVKAHARGLSGPKKFVLLVAHLAKGKVGTEVEVKEVEKRWNKMTASNLLDGEFNTFYSTTAKENGWVNTKRKGIYFLRPQWREIFLD